jgi:hypothetical protein
VIGQVDDGVLASVEHHVSLACRKEGPIGR